MSKKNSNDIKSISTFFECFNNFKKCSSDQVVAACYYFEQISLHFFLIFLENSVYYKNYFPIRVSFALKSSQY